MFIVESYSLAIVFCVITMLCWGSWGNTQKLAGKTWRYELFYWDYVLGILLFSLLMGFTLGSMGEKGVPFLENLQQVAPSGILSAFVGGVIFNLSNIMLSTATSLAGLAVAFPLGVGLALVLGVFNTYFFNGQAGDPVLLFGGVALIVVALIFNGMASAKNSGDSQSSSSKKGILFALGAGILMSTFYSFVAAAMDLENFEAPAAGKATPYVAFFLFVVGIFLSNFVFNTYMMKKPLTGDKPVGYNTYFKGSLGTHMVGVLGGMIWGLGTVFSYIASGQAGASISYALGQGAPMIAALWGVFIWKEFKGGNKAVNTLLTLMFIFFIVGLGMIVAAGNA